MQTPPNICSVFPGKNWIRKIWGSQMVYLFTNHQNLLQAATKGYLSPFAYWRRFRKDLVDEDTDKLYECLIFGKHPLPYAYLYETDKSLHAVAIGIEEKILESMGYSQSGGFYIGTASLPISFIDEIIFETPSGPSLLNNRYIEYSSLLGKTQFPVQPSLFRQEDSKEQVSPVFDKNAILLEHQFDRAFGALGHMLEELKAVNSTDYLLALYLLQTHYSSKNLPLKVEPLISFGKKVYPDWSLAGSDVELLNILLGYAKYGHSHKPTAIKKEYGEAGYTIFTFLNCLDKVLDTVDKSLQSMDRKQLFGSFSSCYAKNKNAQTSIIDVLEKILKIYDYDYTSEDLLMDVSRHKSPILKEFLLGLNIFSHDPIDTKNISQLKASVKLPKQNISFSVALFLWGRTHGAFSLDPVKKLEMLSVYGVENFNTLCIPEFTSSPEAIVTMPPWPGDDKLTQCYGGAKFWIEKDSGEENHGVVLYTTKVTSTQGFTLEYETTDYFEDVKVFLNNFKKGGENLSSDELIFMLEKCIPVFGEISIGDSKYSLVFDHFDKDSLKLGLRQTMKGRITESGLPVSINLPTIDAWNDLVREELSPYSMPVKLKQAIRETLKISTRGRKEKEEPKSKPIVHTNESHQPKDHQADILVPTEKDKKDVILAYMEEKGIKLPSKTTKTELVRAIEIHLGEPKISIEKNDQGDLGF
jgi:hypothetical protein